MPYNPQLNPGDAINLVLSKRPMNTGAGIAIREGAKYGVSNLGENFYNNNRFTTGGGALSGGLSSAGNALLHGAPAGEVAKRGAIGAGMGGATSGVSDYALSNGASAAGAAGAAGAVGSTGNIVAHMAMGDDMSGSDIASGVAAPVAGGIAAGAGMGSYAGPIGAAVGAAIGLLQGLNPHTPRVKGELQVSGPLFKYDQKKKQFVRSGDITGFNSTGFKTGSVPEKDWNAITHAGRKRADYLENQLAGKTFDLDPARAKQMEQYINSNVLSLPKAKGDEINSWMRSPVGLENITKTAEDFASNPNLYLTRYGKIDDASLYDGMDEGGDTAPVAWNPSGYEDDNGARYEDYDSGE